MARLPSRLDRARPREAALGDSVARDFAEHVNPSLLPVAATLLALAGIREGESVVDVACAVGLLAHPAAAASGPAGRVYGIDADDVALSLARARRPSSVCWVRAGAGRLPFAAASVDKVVCGVALHRLADVRPVLAEWARVLAPGGRAAVGAWGELRESAAEDAVLAALSAHGVDPDACARRIALVAGGVPRDPGDLPDLLREAGLRVTYATSGDVTVPFVSAESYAMWRLAFPRAAGALSSAVPAEPERAALRSAVAARVTALLGPDPVLVHTDVHYATATPS